MNMLWTGLGTIAAVTVGAEGIVRLTYRRKYFSLRPKSHRIIRLNKILPAHGHKDWGVLNGGSSVYNTLNSKL